MRPFPLIAIIQKLFPPVPEKLFKDIRYTGKYATGGTFKPGDLAKFGDDNTLRRIMEEPIRWNATPEEINKHNEEESRMKIELGNFSITSIRIGNLVVPVELVNIRIEGPDLIVDLLDDQLLQRLEGDTPKPERPPGLEPFFLVWQPSTGYTKFRHETADAALKEAGRLAREHIGQEFLVLAPIKSVEMLKDTKSFDYSKPKIEGMEDDIPF